MQRRTSLRIAFIGTRGVPATYSGFETFVESVGARLAMRGHDVTVYCRKHHARERLKTYRGMRLTFVEGVATKHLDTITHTAASCAHALTQSFDVVVMCISGNSPLSLIPRLAGSKVVLNVDGSDWRRRKWGKPASTYIRVSEWLAVHCPNATVTDSLVMQRYYRERFGAETICITYGADVPVPDRSDVLQRLGLTPRGYFLLVGRLVPENCIHHLVGAYEQLDTSLKCVIVGDAPYSGDYIAKLKRLGPRVTFPGYVFGDGYRQLLHNAYASILCSEVGGTHPALVEAMAAGNCVVVNGTPANMEVIGDAGIAYDGNRGASDLKEALTSLLEDSDSVPMYRSRAMARARALYSWESVTDSYEQLFFDLLSGRPTGAAAMSGSEVMDR